METPVRQADPPGYAVNPLPPDVDFAYFPAAGEFLPAISLGATAAAFYDADLLAEMRRLVHEADVSERRRLGENFAGRLRDFAPDLQVWATVEPDLLLTVVLPERDLERELHATALFLELARNLSTPEKADITFRLRDEPGSPVGERFH